MKNELFNLSAQNLKRKAEENVHKTTEVAVIGMAVDLPGAKSLDQFWEIISEGVDRVGELPVNRKEDLNRLAGVLSPTKQKDLHFEQAAFLDEIDCFDNAFFNIPYDDAIVINPMHRKLMQVAYHCIQDAGYTRSAISGSKTGVYIGYSWNMNSYFELIKQLYPDLAQYAITQNIASTIAGRISYYFNLQGPSIIVDSACSSSLVGLHQASDAIRHGEIDAALVCGANLTFGISSTGGGRLGIESASKRSLTFDNNADGIGKGEGATTVLIKSLPLAIRDGDRIYAVIKGSASNNDGSRSVGAAAPSVEAQKEVLVQAWKLSGIQPEDLGYIEAHGTGTKLGDPIELEAINSAFLSFTDKKQFCAIGSVKANIGHLDTAAGIAGFVKSVLCLTHRKIPPQIHFHTPNDKISFFRSPVYVNTVASDWNVPKGKKRQCGVSSFGISGTNCHVVLEGFNSKKNLSTNQKNDRFHLFTISANSHVALQQLTRAYIPFLKKQKEVNLDVLCAAVAWQRDQFPYRMVIISECVDDLIEKLNLIVKHKKYNDCTYDWLAYQHLDERKSTSNKDVEISGNDLGRIKDMAVNYLSSKEISWVGIPSERKLVLPNYPFDKIRCWPELNEPELTYELEKQEPKEKKLQLHKKHKPITMKNRNDIYNLLTGMIAETLNTDIDLIEGNKTFFELGFDSINVVHIQRKFQQKFNIDLPVEELYTNFNSIDKLVDLVMQSDELETPRSEPVLQNMDTSLSTVPQLVNGEKDFDANLVSTNGNLDHLFSQQLDLVKRQLELLSMSTPGSAKSSRIPDLQNASITKKGAAKSLASNLQSRPSSHQYIDSRQAYSPEQHVYVQDLIGRLAEKTKLSKERAQKYRSQFSSYRKAMYYDHYFKELVYPIFADSAKGSHFKDLDGNEYLDFAMGFGVHLLGYNNDRITNAISKQLKKGVYIGPMSPLAGEVADLISRIAGVERVAYANSGTEAVMHAVRIARAKTGRDLIVKFSNSYHGFYDAMQSMQNPESETATITNSLGVPNNMVKDVLVLEYGSDHSLEVIKQHIDSIACVLAEPIQSRRPEFQPREFLAEVREITRQADVALIFDEIITGFRVHPRGVAGYYGIEPDIITYGKVVGGGMPLGIVCGKGEYLDYMDGGMWQFGDDSRPTSQRIGTGGTFCHHPVTMAAAKEILTIIEERGDQLYGKLEEHTALLESRLNDYFSTNEIPIKIVRCGSLFSFKPLMNIKVLQVLYYLLLEKGIYLWQGATCFVSDAHTRDDIEHMIKTVQECCEALAKNGFIQRKKIKSTIPKVPQQEHYEVSPSQRRLWFMHQLHNELTAYNLIAAYKLSGLDDKAFQKALELVVKRHESLRTTFTTAKDKPRQMVNKYKKAVHAMVIANHSKEQLVEQDVIDLMLQRAEVVFDLEKGPLYTVVLYKTANYDYIFFNFHHLIADGFSIEIILQELFMAYQALTMDQAVTLPNLNIQYKDYSQWITQKIESQRGDERRKYWKEKLGNLPERVLIKPDFERGKDLTFEADSVLIHLSEDDSALLQSTSRKLDATLFITILAIIKVLINKQAGDGNISVGCPYSGRVMPELNNQVGFYVNTLVLADFIASDETFREVLEKVKNTVIEAGKHQLYPYDFVVKDLAEERQVSRNQLFDIDVNMNDQDLGNYAKVDLSSGGLEAISLKPKTTKFDMIFSIFKSKEIAIALEYKTSLYEASTIALMKSRMKSIISEIIKDNVDTPIAGFNYDSEISKKTEDVFGKKELF